MMRMVNDGQWKIESKTKALLEAFRGHHSTGIYCRRQLSEGNLNADSHDVLRHWHVNARACKERRSCKVL